MRVLVLPGFLALVFAAACGGRAIEIDPDPVRDAGSDTSAPGSDASTHVPIACGPITCASGVCCDTRCGICGSSDGACPAITCAEPIDASPPPKPSDFLVACGDRDCDANAEYCQIMPDDTGMPTTYACMPLSKSCRGANASCDCVPHQCGTCKAVDNDGRNAFTVTCFAG